MPSKAKLERAERIGRERGEAGETWVDGPEEILNMDQNDPEYRKVKDAAFERGKANRDNKGNC